MGIIKRAYFCSAKCDDIFIEPFKIGTIKIIDCWKDHSLLNKILLGFGKEAMERLMLKCLKCLKCRVTPMKNNRSRTKNKIFDPTNL